MCGIGVSISSPAGTFSYLPLSLPPSTASSSPDDKANETKNDDNKMYGIQYNGAPQLLINKISSEVSPAPSSFSSVSPSLPVPSNDIPPLLSSLYPRGPNLQRIITFPLSSSSSLTSSPPLITLCGCVLHLRGPDGEITRQPLSPPLSLSYDEGKEEPIPFPPTLSSTSLQLFAPPSLLLLPRPIQPPTHYTFSSPPTPNTSFLLYNGELFGGFKDFDDKENDGNFIFQLLQKCEMDFLSKSESSPPFPSSSSTPISTSSPSSSLLSSILSIWNTFEGPFAFIYYCSPLKMLLYGRDKMGRRSLVVGMGGGEGKDNEFDNGTQKKDNEMEDMIISSVAINETNVQNKKKKTWHEVAVTGIFCISYDDQEEKGQGEGNVEKQREKRKKMRWYHYIWPYIWANSSENQNKIDVKNQFSPYLLCHPSACPSYCHDYLLYPRPPLPPLNTIPLFSSLLSSLSSSPSSPSYLLNFPLLPSYAPLTPSLISSFFSSHKSLYPSLSLSPLFDVYEKTLLLLSHSVKKRVQGVPSPSSDSHIPSIIHHPHHNSSSPPLSSLSTTSRIGILFSGGLDCMLLARLVDYHLPPTDSIDLLTCGFTGDLRDEAVGYHLPDRISAIRGYEELRRVSGGRRKYNLIYINMTLEDMKRERERVEQMIKPMNSVMDFNIAMVLWFAAMGRGRREEREGVEPEGKGNGQSVWYRLREDWDHAKGGWNEEKKKDKENEHKIQEGNGKKEGENKDGKEKKNVESNSDADPSSLRGYDWSSKQKFLDKRHRQEAKAEGKKQKMEKLNQKGRSPHGVEKGGEEDEEVESHPIPSDFLPWDPITSSCISPSFQSPPPLLTLSSCRVLLHGLGADEYFSGYSRHRTQYSRNSYCGLEEEIRKDVKRLWRRNCGRDDRVGSSHGREMRHPFLDENLCEYISSLPLSALCDLSLPMGIGDKMILRGLCALMGMRDVSTLVKRAMQFGSRIANNKIGGYIQMGGDGGEGEDKVNMEDIVNGFFLHPMRREKYAEDVRMGVVNGMKILPKRKTKTLYIQQQIKDT